MIVDHAGGYVSIDHELRVKLLRENAKEKSLKLSKDKISEWMIVIG
jgi:hypothetical protein